MLCGDIAEVLLIGWTYAVRKSDFFSRPPVGGNWGDLGAFKGEQLSQPKISKTNSLDVL
jgi:hypothetical protein